MQSLTAFANLNQIDSSFLEDFSSGSSFNTNLFSTPCTLKPIRYLTQFGDNNASSEKKISLLQANRIFDNTTSQVDFKSLAKKID